MIAYVTSENYKHIFNAICYLLWCGKILCLKALFCDETRTSFHHKKSFIMSENYFHLPCKENFCHFSWIPSHFLTFWLKLILEDLKKENPLIFLFFLCDEEEKTILKIFFSHKMPQAPQFNHSSRSKIIPLAPLCIQLKWELYFHFWLSGGNRVKI